MKVATKGYVLAKGEESVAPAGFAPPPHVHHAEDEAFYVLEGDVTFTCGDRTWNATAGSFAFLPRDVPHQFQVSDAGPLKMLQLTLPAQFDRFAAEVGESARANTLPAPTEPDVPKLLAASAKYKIEIMPPR